MRTDPATGEVVLTASVAGGHEELRASRLLVATGRRSVTQGLSLDAVGVATGDRGELVVQNTLVSTNPWI